MNHNAYDTNYPYSINNDEEELAYNIWEANRIITIARATGDKKLEQSMKSRLRRLGYSLKDSTADITFTINDGEDTLASVASIGLCYVCGATAWATSDHGLLCPSHNNALGDYLTENEYKSLSADELVDALEDVGFQVAIQFPYVIVSLKNRPITPGEVAFALDIDPALCCYNLNGNIRITCE
jgi:hypothetical protein